ncbi:DNA pilot protein [Dipodfec virus UOA04_Rod_653]|nr:DNA pilot protein [Dipodfec virus UOA04_Rod_653]
MDPLIGLGLLTGGASLIGNAINAGSQSASNSANYRNQSKLMGLQHEYAMKQMVKQYELLTKFNKDYFDYQNAYNDPSAVMSRFSKAGISPAAVLGASGVGINAVSSSAPSGGIGSPAGPSNNYQHRALDFSGIGASVNSAIESSLLMKQTNSTVDRNAAAAERDRAEARYMAGETHSQDYRAIVDSLDVEAHGKRNRSMDDQHDIDVAQSRILRNSAELSDWTLGGSIDSAIASQQITIEEAKRARQLTPKYAEILDAQVAVQTAQAYYYGSQGEYFSELADMTQLQAYELSREIQNNWLTKYSIKLPDGSTQVWSMQDFMNATAQNRTIESFYTPEEARGKAQQSLEWKRREIFHELMHVAGQAIFSRGLRGSGETTYETETSMGDSYERRHQLGPNGEPRGSVVITKGSISPAKTKHVVRKK